MSGYNWGETERGFDKRPNMIEGAPLGRGYNATKMREHGVRPYQEPLETDKVSVAFLARAPIKFTEHLRSPEVIVRRETLGTMSRWLVAHPKHKTSQITAGAVPVLTKLLSDEDVQVREGASRVLELLGTLYAGVQAMLKARTVELLLLAVTDQKSEETRLYAHRCLHLLGEYPQGSEDMVRAKGTTLLVKECLERPSPEALQSLGYCLRNPIGLREALQHQANAAMVKCLGSTSPPVIQFASKNLSSLTIELAAKEEAIAEGAVPVLVGLLEHRDWPVRSAACCALTSITIAVEGKRQAFNAGAVRLLTDLLGDTVKSVVLYAVRCIGNLAELRREVMLTPHDSVYRATFERAMPQLKVIMGHQDRVLAKSARDAADLIKWRP